MDEQELTGIEPEEVEEQEEATTSEEPESAPEETEEEATEEEQEEDKPEPKGVQKRINQLVKEREEERRRADRVEQMLHELYMKQQQQSQPQKQETVYPEAPPIPPDRYAYDSDEAYHAELQKYQRDADLYYESKSKRQLEQFVQSIQQNKQQQTVTGFLNETREKGTQKYEDFDQVGFIPQGMEEIFQQADNAEDVAYYLGQNPQEVQRITRMSPHQAAFEVAKLDARFSAPVEKKVTKAPPPVKPVGGREPSKNNILDLPVEDYIREMNKKQYG